MPPGHMQMSHVLRTCAVFVISGASLNVTAQRASVSWLPVTRSELCVTEGSIGQLSGQSLSVDVSKMRAYIDLRTQPVVEARFSYLGPTENEAPLASGEMRRQFGLKLRAQDACNLVYVMWRIAPESKLVVSVKSNPGQHASNECGNHGYQNIKPGYSAPLPALRTGDTHRLRAEMNGAEMRVFADDSLVWQGSVIPAALEFDGPIGVRSDNARLSFQLERSARVGPAATVSCRAPESE
jgi:hypothetical protein